MKSVLLLPLFWLLHNFLTTTVYVPIKASVSIIFQSNDNDQQQYERISNITNSNAFSPSFSPLSLAAVTQEEEEKEEGGGEQQLETFHIWNFTRFKSPNPAWLHESEKSAIIS